MRGIPIGQQKDVWERYTQRNETLKTISADTGFTYDQCREVIRRFRHGIRESPPTSNEIVADAKMDSMAIRRKAFNDLNIIVNSVDEATANKLGAIMGQLKIADAIDRFEGRGTPRTQINIIQVDRLNSLLDRVIDWLVDHLSDSQKEEFYKFSDELDKERKDIPAIDAEYTVVNESG